MTLPSKSPITLPFGAISEPYSEASPHMGTDFAYIPDNTIYAAEAGVVTCVTEANQSAPRDGNAIYMTVGPNFHGFLHMSQFLVSSGQRVAEGQPIGIMGDSGAAEGVHLHWAVKVNKKFIDPMSLIEEDEMSNIGDVEARILIKHIYGYTSEIDIEGAIPGILGGESNTIIRMMDASPTAANYQQYLADLKKAAAGSAPNVKPYSGPELFVKG